MRSRMRELMGEIEEEKRRPEARQAALGGERAETSSESGR